MINIYKVGSFVITASVKYNVLGSLNKEDLFLPILEQNTYSRFCGELGCSALFNAQ